MRSKKQLIILCSVVLVAVMACGVIFQLIDSDGMNCPHLFQMTKYDQVASVTEHNAKRICRTCGEVLSEKKGEHVYQTSTSAPTDAQLVGCPSALEVISDKCIVCDHVKSATAILADLTFDGDLRIPIGEYEGSANYQTLLTLDPSVSYKHVAAYFDQDPAFTCWSTSLEAKLADGKLVVAEKQFCVQDDLNLFGVGSIYQNASITFDLTVNYDPALNTSANEFAIFQIVDQNLYNNRPVVLALGEEDVDDTDDVKTYELFFYSRKGGKVAVEAKTGVTVELGKEYTYKIDIDADSEQITLWYKLTGTERFQKVGTYTYVPSNNITVVKFANHEMSYGNTFDNYRVTVNLK